MAPRTFLHRILGWFGLGAKPQSDVSILVVGLGNPGEEYENTRHNCGFLAVDELVKSLEATEQYEADKAEITVGRLPGGKTIACAKPLTFMNRSGQAVGPLVRRFALDPSALLIAVDDFAIPLGRLRFRKQGSDGGHNGLKSIAQHCGEGYPRLRIGIGPSQKKTRVIDFVLGEFVAEEEDKKNTAIRNAAEAIAFYCEQGMEAAMGRFNAASPK